MLPYLQSRYAKVEQSTRLIFDIFRHMRAKIGPCNGIPGSSIVMWTVMAACDMLPTLLARKW